MYTIQIRKKALREIKNISPPYRLNIIEAINNLANNPRPHGCKKLKAEEELYRIRISDYRVVYSIEDQIKIVEVTKVGHRRDIYNI